MNPFRSFLKRQEGARFSSLSLGRVMGIPIRLHPSWFIIFALVTVSLSWQYFPRAYPNWDKVLYWEVGLATSLLFFASVVAHELAHSWFSQRQGIPVRSITLFIFGGVARISREAPLPRQELAMAAAGPISSLVLAGLFALVRWLVGPYNEPIAALAAWLFNINVILAVFNLIPGFPLDGGRVLRAILWKTMGSYKRATRWASRVGQGVAYSFIVGGIGMAFITGNWFGGLWLAFIGWFLENVTTASYRQAMFREALRGLTVREVMAQDCIAVPQELTLNKIVEEHLLPSGRTCLLASDGHQLSGILTLRDIKAIPRDRWEATTLGQAATPIDRLRLARVDDDAVEILDRMDEADINQMPVVDAGNLIGIVTRDNLLRIIRARSELGG